MKFLYTILSLYFLMLCTIPCEDRCGDGHSGKAQQEATHATSHQESTDSGCHGCSPFCVCNCCQVQVVEGFRPIIQPVFTNPVEISSAVISSNPEEITLPVWEPPKIS